MIDDNVLETKPAPQAHPLNEFAETFGFNRRQTMVGLQKPRNED